MGKEPKRTRRPFRWAIVLGLGAALAAGVSPVPAAAGQTQRPLNVLVLLGEWFGDAYFPLAKEIEARGWTMKRIGLDGEYRGCYNKKRDVVLRSDIVIRDKMDLSGYDALIIPSGPQWRKFNENRTVLKFVQDAHAAGLVVAAFCVGNTTVKAAGLVDLPAGPELFPNKVTLVKERVLLGPRGGGPPPGDGFESAPIKEVCDAVARELEGKPDRAADNASGAKAPLSLTYVANMGVLVGSDGTKVLIDALFDRPNPEYRSPEPGVLDKIIKGEAPYDGVKLALVTHNHPDHFAADVAVRFLESRPEAILLAPSDAVAEMREAAADWTKLVSRVISFELEAGDFRRLKAAGIPITAVRTLHSGGGESPMNIMYLFEIGGRRIFHEGDSTGKPEVFEGFGLESAPVDLAVVHFWFPLEPNMAKYLQEVLQPDHIALGHLPIRLESDAPGKIDMVRQYYKDLTLLLPGLPSRFLQFGTPTVAEGFFGQAPPGTEATEFAAEIHSPSLCPHGQLAFALDGSGVFWSAIALEGRQQTIYWSAFDGNAFSPPVVAPFAAGSGNGGPTFSPDGRRLFFNVEIPGPDAASPKTMAIAYVERSGSGWTKPVQIESTVDTLMTKGQVSVARSGNIYFVGRILTERTPAIFVSRFADGRYSPPEKLAGPIAGLPLVSDPWVDPDERFLLVASPPAEGPSMLTDIGICSRLSDGTWSEPVRLSGPVNTPAFERFASLSSDGAFLFFVRSSSPQFVGDQAHFYWIGTKGIPELRAMESGRNEAERGVAVLSGPCLGEKPPDPTPEIFAPGVVSRDGIQMKLTMSVDGAEILYTERDPATNAASFILRRRKGDSWSEPLVLPYSREYMDIEPSLSRDGTKILFVSNRPASGQGDPEKTPDIWLAEKTGDHWGKPVRLGPPVCIDDPADIEAHPAFLPDGGIYFMRQNGKTRRLFHAARRGDGFAEPVPLPLKEDLLAGQFSGPCLSPDGRTLLMHSRREGGFGNWDLYAAFEDGSGGWSELKNLGPAVNTDKPESSPTFSPDGRSLFFTRETDIYRVSAAILEELRPRKAETRR